MVYRRRRILLSEIDRQCRFAMIAYGDASTAIETRDAERCWYSLQGLLAAVAQLHELLWPSAGDSPEWALELRAALQVGDDSPLNLPRIPSPLDLVTALDSWIAPRATGHPVISSFASGGAAAEATDCVRCFDPESGAFTLFGHVVALPPLLNAIAELAQKTEAEVHHLREVV
jgi:hypothetical protein